MTRLSGVLAFLAVAAVVSVAPGAARSEFDGKVCSLVTPTAQHTAGVTAPCVQTTARPAYLAEWGTPTSDHFLSVQVGAPTPAIAKPTLRPDPILPRPQHWKGPVLVAPGVLAYYIQSPYNGVAKAAGKMKFIDGGYLTQIGLTDTSAPALTGMMAVARSIVARL